MVEHLINAITGFIAHTGYPGVLFLMALESACIPIPSEAIMPFAGALVKLDPARGFNLHVLAFVGATGNLLGSILAYWVGHKGGRPFLEKYGKYVLIRKRDLDKSDEFFHKHGELTVLVSRVLPIVRTFISLPAGIARMNFPASASTPSSAPCRSATCWPGWGRSTPGTCRRLTAGCTSRTSPSRSFC